MHQLFEDSESKMIDWGRDIIQSIIKSHFSPPVAPAWMQHSWNLECALVQTKRAIEHTPLFWCEEQERGLLMLRVSGRNSAPHFILHFLTPQPSVWQSRINKASVFWPEGVKRGHPGNMKVSEGVWRGRSWEKWPHKVIYELMDRSPACVYMDLFLNCLP